MKKLIRGIIDFRKTVRPSYRETFAQLALGQKPDTLFVACSDSRVVPNLFASSDPGDLFVIRNVGNLIPPCNEKGVCESDQSEGAAIEFALHQLSVREVIICGHSECGAMAALEKGLDTVSSPNLKSWLRHAEELPQKKESFHLKNEKELKPHNLRSQLNVLSQIEHLKTYPIVQKKIQEGTLSLHGWWFNVQEASVYAFESEENQFCLIDDQRAEKLLAEFLY